VSLDIDDLNQKLKDAGLSARLHVIQLSPEEKLRAEGFRKGIEEYGQELWCIYHWIVHCQDGNTGGIYRLREWLEKFSIPDNTGGVFLSGGYSIPKEE